MGYHELDEGVYGIQRVTQQGDSQVAVAGSHGGDPAFAGDHLTVLLVVAVLGHDEFGRQRNDMRASGLHQGRQQNTVGVAYGSVAVLLGGAGGTLDGMRVVVAGAVEGEQQSVAEGAPRCYQVELPEERKGVMKDRLEVARIDAVQDSAVLPAK